jgi:hypothetical protein
MERTSLPVSDFVRNAGARLENELLHCLQKLYPVATQKKI